MDNPEFTDASKVHWKMYGQGSGKINFYYDNNETKYPDSENANPVHLTVPNVRYYYRTFSCERNFTVIYKYNDTDKIEKENKTEIRHKHYFNVFTRPSAATTFPVMFLVRPDTLEKSFPKKIQPLVNCGLRQYYDETTKAKELSEKNTYIGAPFQFYWKFPGKKDEDESHEALYQRPPGGDIYWGKQSMDFSSRYAVSLEKHERAKPLTKVRKIEYFVV